MNKLIGNKVLHYSKNNVLLWLVCTVFLFLILPLTGCATFWPTRKGPTLIYESAPQRPAWITRLPPNEDYFYAVGMQTGASSLEKAKYSAVQMAVAEITDYLGVRVNVHFEQRISELVTKVLDEITTTSRARITGSRISEMYYEQYREVFDGKVDTTYDVYILARIPYAEIQQEKERQERELEQTLVQVKKIIAEGVKYQQEGNLNLAFQKWFLALEIVEETAASSAMKYEIIGKIKDTINRLTISFIDDEEKITTINQLPAKLSFQVWLRGEKDIPLKNIPIRFGFLTGQGVLDESAVTDSDGKAYCSIYSIEPWPQKVMIKSYLITKDILPESKKTLASIYAGSKRNGEQQKSNICFFYQ